MIIICDIDGTIADGSHRIHLIQNNPKNWDAYFGLAGGDTPIQPVIAFIKNMIATDESSSTKIYFVSGRSSVCRKATEKWLDEHFGFTYEALIMREEGNHELDDKLKARILKDHFLDKGIDKQDIVVFDDRQRVVDMWRKNGILCFQPRNGDF